MEVHPRLLWVSLACACTASSFLNASMRFNGYAKLQQTSLQTKASISHDFNSFGPAKFWIDSSVTVYGAIMGFNGNAPIAAAPGAVIEDRTGDFRFLVSGTTDQTATEQNAILGKDILILASNEIESDGTYPGTVDVANKKLYLIADAESEAVTETSLQFTDAINKDLITYRDTASITQEVVYSTDLIPDSFAVNDAVTVTTDGDARITYTAGTFTANRFYPLKPENANTKYVIARSATTNGDIQLNYLLNHTINANTNSAYTYIDYDSMEYLEASLGVNIDYDISPSSAVSLNFGLNSPVESIQHQSFYYEISPQISAHGSANVVLNMRQAQFSIGQGVRYDRYSTVVRTLQTTGNPGANEDNSSVLRSSNQEASSILSFSEISAAFEVYDYAAFTIGYSASQKYDNFTLLGADNNASIQFQSFSIGFRSSFKDRTLM